MTGTVNAVKDLFMFPQQDSPEQSLKVTQPRLFHSKLSAQTLLRPQTDAGRTIKKVKGTSIREQVSASMVP